MLKESDPFKDRFSIQSGYISDQRRLSESLWNFQWSSTLPLPLHGDSQFTFQQASYLECVEFIEQHKNDILEENEQSGAFLNFDLHPSKRIFLETFSDLFSFKDEDQIIGIYTANPIDWSSYYFRYINVLPEYRGFNLAIKSISFLIEHLKKHGVERILCDVSPSNLRQITRLTKLGFNIVGQETSERWGTLLKFNKFLSKKHEKYYLNQFCQGARPQSNNP